MKECDLELLCFVSCCCSLPKQFCGDAKLPHSQTKGTIHDKQRKEQQKSVAHRSFYIIYIRFLVPPFFRLFSLFLFCLLWSVFRVPVKQAEEIESPQKNRRTSEKESLGNYHRMNRNRRV